VNVVVLHKPDRLTRSLCDFVRIAEIPDRHNASIVSITQQFATNTSMGRLTLNMLLSFAEFERDLISERTADKYQLRLELPDRVMVRMIFYGGVEVVVYSSDAEGAKSAQEQ